MKTLKDLNKVTIKMLSLEKNFCISETIFCIEEAKGNIKSMKNKDFTGKEENYNKVLDYFVNRLNNLENTLRSVKNRTTIEIYNECVQNTESVLKHLYRSHKENLSNNERREVLKMIYNEK